MGRTRRARAAVLPAVAALLLVTTAQACATGLYEYFDDFSTDAAMDVSYLHSPLVAEPPDITLDGVLMYGWGISGRSLYFFDGFLVDAYAFLYYRLPHDGSVADIDSGIVEFDMMGHTHPGGGMRIIVTFVGTGGGFIESITEDGHYQFTLSPDEACDEVLLHFEGGYVMLDNLDVALYGSTPVRDGSWAKIKSLFRYTGEQR